METNNSSTSKRFRSEDSSADYQTLCPFCTFNTNCQVDFDFHNHIHHEHICSECSHVFPSYFLLDLHMNELHNNYAIVQSYRCLIESCSEIFSNIEQRSQHMTDEHHTKNRYFNEIFFLFSNQQMNVKKNNEHDNKFGCDSQKTFIRNSRLKPRQFPNTHWDGDE
jgi:hypothetical protein